jgi:hypothetical protein
LSSLLLLLLGTVALLSSPFLSTLRRVEACQRYTTHN